MTSYALRTNSHDYVELIVDKCSEYAYAYETGDLGRKHIHWWIKPRLCVKSFRNFLNSIGLTGNGGYSMTKCDVEYPIVYLSYIFKKGRYNSGTLDEKIMQLVQACTEEYKEKTRKKVALRGDQITEYLDQRKVTPENVMSHLVNYYLDQKLSLNSHVMLNYARTYLVRRNPKYRRQYICWLTDQLMGTTVEPLVILPELQEQDLE